MEKMHLLTASGYCLRIVAGSLSLWMYSGILFGIRRGGRSQLAGQASRPGSSTKDNQVDLDYDLEAVALKHLLDLSFMVEPRYDSFEVLVLAQWEQAHQVGDLRSVKVPPWQH